jgi:hypothetical protein
VVIGATSSLIKSYVSSPERTRTRQEATSGYLKESMLLPPVPPVRNIVTPEEDLYNRFSFHPANTADKQLAHQSIRSHCLELAGVLNELLPDGREKSLAITKLEETMMWANASIARYPLEAPQRA